MDFKQVQKSDRINSDRSPRIGRKTFFLSQNYWTFAPISLRLGLRVISRGLITFLRWSEVSDPSWSGRTCLEYFVARRINDRISCVQIDFYMSSSLLFFIVFSNVSCYSTRMKFCCIWFRFCPLKSIFNLFSQSQFSVLHIMLLIFFNILNLHLFNFN